MPSQKKTGDVLWRFLLQHLNDSEKAREEYGIITENYAPEVIRRSLKDSMCQSPDKLIKLLEFHSKEKTPTPVWTPPK